MFQDQVYVQLPTSAVAVTLLAFAAKRLAAARAVVAGRPMQGFAVYRWIPLTGTALSSKPAACRGCCRMMGQTDGRFTVLREQCQ